MNYLLLLLAFVVGALGYYYFLVGSTTQTNKKTSTKKKKTDSIPDVYLGSGTSKTNQQTNEIKTTNTTKMMTDEPNNVAHIEGDHTQIRKLKNPIRVDPKFITFERT